mmetsp:Transcript_110925/g.192337  ORF Transcript_110925/g.192337 Transcript_110925/m.192337 type:complete len:655 (-) Transcript_110925:152-2116(-)
MPAGGVSVEIECQDEENSFHTTYRVEKYPQYARRLEHAIRSCFSNEGIQHSILLNQNPPKGYVPYQNVKNFYVSRREPDSKVRYPRLGSFEVLLRCPRGFAGHVPDQLWVWSKLQSRRWPDPDRLARDMLQLVVSGQQDEDISEIVHKFRASFSPQVSESPLMTSTRPSSSSRSGRSDNPPMFFSLSPRQRVPTPVEVRSPVGRHREHRRVELPPRPMSATSPARPAPPQRQRPASAVGLSSSSQSVGQWITGAAAQSAAEKMESPTSSVGQAAAHATAAPAAPVHSWGEDEDPFETAAASLQEPRSTPAAAPLVTQAPPSQPSSAWASPPAAQVVAEAPAHVVAEPPAQMAVVTQPATQVAAALPTQVQAAQPLSQQPLAPAEPTAQSPAWATAVAAAPPASEPPAAAPVAAAPTPLEVPAAVKPGGDYDDYADDFEDDPGSPAGAKTPTTHAGDNTVLTMTDTSALSAEPPQAVVTQPAAASASASSFAPQPQSNPMMGQAVNVQPALASAVASAAASASAATARAEASRELAAEEVEEYEDEPFEEEDVPSPAQPPMKSDGTASTATRGSNADGENEDPDVEDIYEEGFEGDDDVEEDVQEHGGMLSSKDRIVVEGQSYDYAEDNEFDEEVSDMSREVSIDDAHSVKSVED